MPTGIRSLGSACAQGKKLITHVEEGHSCSALLVLVLAPQLEFEDASIEAQSLLHIGNFDRNVIRPTRRGLAEAMDYVSHSSLAIPNAQPPLPNRQLHCVRHRTSKRQVLANSNSTTDWKFLPLPPRGNNPRSSVLYLRLRSALIFRPAQAMKPGSWLATSEHARGEAAISMICIRSCGNSGIHACVTQFPQTARRYEGILGQIREYSMRSVAFAIAGLGLLASTSCSADIAAAPAEPVVPAVTPYDWAGPLRGCPRRLWLGQ